jgi:hypothetical protein
MVAAMNALRDELNEADARYEQIRSAVDRLHPDSDLGEIEWVLYQFVRLDFGPASDPHLALIRQCRAEDDILHAIKRAAKVSMRVIRAALVCQRERVARHRRRDVSAQLADTINGGKP